MKKKTVFHILLGLCACVIFVYGILHLHGRDEARLQYPGNGLPHLSANKEMTRLSTEIATYAASFEKTSMVEGRLSFQDINGFNFISNMGITGKEYHLRVDVHITRGTCIIKIGNVQYAVRKEGITIHDGSNLIYTNHVEPIRVIALMAYSYGATETIVDSDTALLTSQNVSRAMPAFIQISLRDGCTGSIGPWRWIRGME